MRLVVDTATDATSAQAFTSANQVAAIQENSLVGKLGSYAAMAGDDSSSAEFAAECDEAAGEALGAFADLVPAFANLGRLTERSAANHRAANDSSVVTGAVVYDGRSALADGACVAVLAPSLPSALGDACEQYASHVDQERQEVLALVEEILRMIVEGIVISVAAGLIAGGTGAIAAGGSPRVVHAQVPARDEFGHLVFLRLPGPGHGRACHRTPARRTRRPDQWLARPRRTPATTDCTSEHLLVRESTRPVMSTNSVASRPSCGVTRRCRTDSAWTAYPSR